MGKAPLPPFSSLSVSSYHAVFLTGYTFLRLNYSRHSGCRPQFHVVLHATCCGFRVKCCSRVPRPDYAQVSSSGRRSLHIWKYVYICSENMEHPPNSFQTSIFLVLYAIGIVELQLESTSALILLIFIIPLAFTLSGFLLWIMYSLNGMQNEISGIDACPNNTSATIAHLRARKQRFKLKMFERLYYILLFAVLIIAIFFVVSTMSFSGRLAEGEYLFILFNFQSWFLILSSRLFRENLALSLVVIGWLSCSLIPHGLRQHRILVASK
jgi:hypothetical protein